MSKVLRCDFCGALSDADGVSVSGTPPRWEEEHACNECLNKAREVIA